MNRFTTRVVLHNAESEDYDILHEAMENEGFSRTIISEDGTEYHLPDAEYNLIGDYTRKQVLNKSKSAADLTDLEYQILVTKSFGSRTWFGLDSV